MCQIPFDGPVEPVGKLRFGQLAKLIVDLRGVDRIAHIVALAVGDERDEAFGLAEFLADKLHDIYPDWRTSFTGFSQNAIPYLEDNRSIYRKIELTSK